MLRLVSLELEFVFVNVNSPITFLTDKHIHVRALFLIPVGFQNLRKRGVVFVDFIFYGDEHALIYVRTSFTGDKK